VALGVLDAVGVVVLVVVVALVATVLRLRLHVHRVNLRGVRCRTSVMSRREVTTLELAPA
jgi:hypothetical protein